jgi:hypothetical protein
MIMIGRPIAVLYLASINLWLQVSSFTTSLTMFMLMLIVRSNFILEAGSSRRPGLMFMLMLVVRGSRTYIDGLH